MKQRVIENYEQRIENLNWHLLNNGEYISEQEFAKIKARIEDYEEFVTILKGL